MRSDGSCHPPAVNSPAGPMLCRPPAMTGFVRAGVVLIIMLAAPPGCRRKQPAPPPPPPAAVTVARPIQRDVLDWDEYTGYLAAPETVELRARVSGMVVDAPFAEGRIVRKGDLLYELDARPFQAELDARLADVQRAEATVANRQADYDRQVEALQANAVPQQQVDDAKAMLLGAQADVAAARAAAEAARLNVEFCRVTSPIDGRA
ncbi:MAG TPA: efflux RND transporter periplasmic adaptor subunit, partial [Tepidisphaeraceae bacterium]|nr:efflux RND transporter periplasmic adaptor subunit [Tepidisphaeraceae bacterium]